MKVRLNILPKERAQKVNYTPFSTNDDFLSVSPIKEVIHQKIEGKTENKPNHLIRSFIGDGSLPFRIKGGCCQCQYTIQYI
ncbi:hypothetical protein CIL05_09440 [Virgibacillus profundi]|uniref:Uncharacterized protein n=1 Tax=Virgibacillus profundi TaxID=2024555 RepID=A0A2A2IFF0_9BACI|nr:hypothetical protein [Virgibacillus profundi]PAV30088.1 hypothetical protein CIL05_09440 [Virgibacillus profundi]PXY54261.1 hypothetical protein CIT14_09530 [Virgibacillus profundi]